MAQGSSPPPIDVEALADVLGRAYEGGPFECVRCGDRACFIQAGDMARCFACRRDITVWSLRRVVFEDPALYRKLLRRLSAA